MNAIMRQATDTEVKALPYWDSRLELFFTDLSDQFMQDAKLVRDAESTDKAHSTGAVIVKDGKVLAMDANQAGFKHKLFIEWHRQWLCVRRWFKVKSGTKYWLCPGCAKAKDHAESRSSREAMAKHGANAIGAALYLYGHWWCCKPCSDAMVKAGVTKVILPEGAKEIFK